MIHFGLDVQIICYIRFDLVTSHTDTRSVYRRQNITHSKMSSKKDKAQKSLTKEEELLLQDFSRNVSTKSSALFYGNALIVSAIPICKYATQSHQKFKLIFLVIRRQHRSSFLNGKNKLKKLITFSDNDFFSILDTFLKNLYLFI